MCDHGGLLQDPSNCKSFPAMFMGGRQLTPFFFFWWEFFFSHIFCPLKVWTLTSPWGFLCLVPMEILWWQWLVFGGNDLDGLSSMVEWFTISSLFTYTLLVWGNVWVIIIIIIILKEFGQRDLHETCFFLWENFVSVECFFLRRQLNVFNDCWKT